MSSLITDMDEFAAEHKKKGGRVLEVTQKVYYVIPEYEGMSTEEIKEEWFVKFNGRSHAYKDASKIYGAEHIVDIKEL